MKRILLIGVLLDAGTITTHAQTIQTLIQQLASLEQLRTTTEKGYQLVEKGVYEMGTASGGESKQEENYFYSLTQKKEPLNSSSTASTALHLQNVLIERIMNAMQYWTDQKLLKIKK